MFNISGKIIFADKQVPETIPDGSLLTVKVQDTNRMCAPAVGLGDYRHIIRGYKYGDPLTYEIKNAKVPSYQKATLKAFLNIGWQASEDEWIRPNDYLNDTTHPVQIEENKINYTANQLYNLILGEAGTQDMFKISGKIIFANGEVPEAIPDGSLLTVKVEDTNMMDAPAVRLGEYKEIIQNYKYGDSLTYEIKNAAIPSYQRATLSAVLNIGWQASGNEWIRRNDYLNDTMHPVDIVENKTEYFECDINVIHYT